MKSLWENFRLELRASFRSKAFALLLLATLAWMLGIPSVLHDDGTASGAYVMRVRYTLGVVFALVLVTLSASGAGTLAKDRVAKRLQLSLVRPVRHWTIAFGRLAALVVVGASVLALAATILFFQIGRGRSCDHVLSPHFRPAREVARENLTALLENPQNELLRQKLAEQGESIFLDYLTTRVMGDYQVVKPGESAEWTFDTSSIDPSDEVSISMRMTDLWGLSESVTGVFELGERRGEISEISASLAKLTLSQGKADGKLVFHNTGMYPMRIYARRDIKLLVKADAFGWNLMRIWLVMTAILSFALSVAIFLGATLSRSVAIFSVLAMVVLMSITPVIIEDYPDPTQMTRVDRMGYYMTEFSSLITRPMTAYSPISDLENEACLEYGVLARALAVNGLLFPLVFSFISGLVMVRKQDGI